MYAEGRETHMIEIVTEIEISGSAARIWHALMDFSAYPRWNPAIRSIAGSAKPGATLRVLFHPKGTIPIWFRATVSVVTAESEFRWTGSLLAPQIFAGDHYFKLQPIGPSRFKLLQGEVFSGALAPLLYRMLGEHNRSGFVAMNQALKAYVEAGSRPDRGLLAQA